MITRQSQSTRARLLRKGQIFFTVILLIGFLGSGILFFLSAPTYDTSTKFPLLNLVFGGMFVCGIIFLGAILIFMRALKIPIILPPLD